MARWVQLASEWLKPIYRQIKDQMMRGSYLQVDETPIRYLDPGNGKTGLGYLWVAHRPGEDVLLERRTGYFSVMPMPANAVRSSTQSSKAAGVTPSSDSTELAEVPTLICTTY
jgi:hypothetical protein